MTVKELIAELQKVENKSLEVYVWSGYNASTMTTDFEVRYDCDSNTVDLTE